MTERLVVVGAGMASGRAIETLIEADPSAYRVTLFGAEPRGNYDRVMLSPVLAGEKTYDQIVTHDADWYARAGVETRFGEPVTAIDRARRVVVSARGETPYDRLLIATGSTPFVLPVPGRDLPGVLAYRDLDDVEAMVAMAATPGRRAVVIGGGLLGLEAAAGLTARGMAVTVVHLMGHLMERQLDPEAGRLLHDALAGRGIAMRLDARTEAILGERAVEGVALADGSEIAADLVVMAAGIRPNVALARAAGLAVGRGIEVDDAMTTADPAVLAIGECAEHRGVCYGLVAPLYEQASVAAHRLLGRAATFEGADLSTKLKVTGCDLFSAGDFADGEGREAIVLRDPARGVYKRLVLAGDRIVGVVMVGDTADGGWFFRKLKAREDVSAGRETLILGPAFAGSATPDAAAASPGTAGAAVSACEAA
ncbi:MAG: NAD(P)/FAD-dependent oxidoreductase [Paracoccaceae bacterium]